MTLITTLSVPPPPIIPVSRRDKHTLMPTPKSKPRKSIPGAFTAPQRPEQHSSRPPISPRSDRGRRHQHRCFTLLALALQRKKKCWLPVARQRRIESVLRFFGSAPSKVPFPILASVFFSSCRVVALTPPRNPKHPSVPSRSSSFPPIRRNFAV